MRYFEKTAKSKKHKSMDTKEYVAKHVAKDIIPVPFLRNILTTSTDYRTKHPTHSLFFGPTGELAYRGGTAGQAVGGSALSGAVIGTLAGLLKNYRMKKTGIRYSPAALITGSTLGGAGFGALHGGVGYGLAKSNLPSSGRK